MILFYFFLPFICFFLCCCYFTCSVPPISSVFFFPFFEKIIIFKVMNVLRGDTGGSEQTRKGNLCHLVLHLCFSAAAARSHRFHSSQHNEPETSKRGLRGRERERRREGDKSGKSDWRKKGWKKRQTPKYLFFVEMHGVVTEGYFLLHCSACGLLPSPWDTNRFNLYAGKSQRSLIKAHIHVCSTTLMVLPTAAYFIQYQWK